MVDIAFEWVPTARQRSHMRSSSFVSADRIRLRAPSMTSLFDGFRSAMNRLSGDHGRVLVAEDHGELANVIAMLLRHCGFDVRTAHDGRIVLALARAFRPHHILLDIKLPGLGGYQLAKLLREDPKLEGTVIIGIAAYRPVAGCLHAGRRPFRSLPGQVVRTEDPARTPHQSRRRARRSPKPPLIHARHTIRQISQHPHPPIRLEQSQCSKRCRRMAGPTAARPPGS